MKRKVIVVDDNKDFLEIVKDSIEFRTDFRGIAFSNPEDALRYMLDEKDIYAVVTDYKMPQMNGFELTKQIISKLPTTKIIVMSGHDTRFLERIALKQGIDENKVKLLCKSDIINLVVMLNS